MATKNTQPKRKRLIQKEVYVTDIFVSVVVAIRDDVMSAEDIVKYLRELNDLLYRRYSNFEVIIVDNALPAELTTSIMALLSELPCIRLVRLSRRYSHDTAIMSGLESSIGDYVVITDPTLDDMKDLPEIVTKSIDTDIVQGVAVAIGRSGRVKTSFARRLFYWYGRRYMRITVPINATYFICLTRRAVRAITTSGRNDSHLRQAIARIGHSYTTFPYSTLANPIISRSLKVGVAEALDIISSYSVHPLRFMSWIGFFASIASIIYAAYVLYIAATHQHVAEGWTTMSLQISGLFFILFLIMIVLSEYIGKLLVEMRHEEKYLVLDELSSTVSLADVGRRNIESQ